MVVNEYDLYEEFEVEKGPGYVGRLTAYLLDNSPEIDPARRRPAVLICPGGAYVMTSDREAEAVAVRFLAKGFQAFVLRYSCAPACFPTQLVEASMAMAFIRRNCEEFMADRDRVGVIGFSAGGHLAATLSVLYNDHRVFEVFDLEIEENKPDFSILCYPVISCEPEISNALTFDSVSGGNAGIREYLSLEQRVHADVPPTFLWHTANDSAVNVKNSLLYAGALADSGVPFELHVFENGVHGLSVADRETVPADNPQCYNENVQQWLPLVFRWLERRELVL